MKNTQNKNTQDTRKVVQEQRTGQKYACKNKHTSTLLLHQKCKSPYYCVCILTQHEDLKTEHHLYFFILSKHI